MGRGTFLLMYTPDGVFNGSGLQTILSKYISIFWQSPSLPPHLIHSFNSTTNFHEFITCSNCRRFWCVRRTRARRTSIGQ